MLDHKFTQVTQHAACDTTGSRPRSTSYVAINRQAIVAVLNPDGEQTL